MQELGVELNCRPPPRVLSNGTFGSHSQNGITASASAPKKNKQTNFRYFAPGAWDSKEDKCILKPKPMRIPGKPPPPLPLGSLLQDHTEEALPPPPPGASGVGGHPGKLESPQCLQVPAGAFRHNDDAAKGVGTIPPPPPPTSDLKARPQSFQQLLLQPSATPLSLNPAPPTPPPSCTAEGTAPTRKETTLS